jgi:hypothetical protein
MGQDQSQQIHRIGDLARSQKCFRRARRNRERFRSAKPRDDVRPVFIHKRFVSHDTLESQTIPARKSILAPVGVGRVFFAPDLLHRQGSRLGGRAGRNFGQ